MSSVPVDPEALRPVVERIVAEIFQQKGYIYSKEELATKEDLIQVLKVLEKKFDSVDKRFEAIDKRFEAIDKRFEAIDKRFETLIEDMNRRFEAVDKRFEEMNTRFEKMIDNLRELITRQDRAFEKLRKDVHSLGSRFGRRLEQVVRELMSRSVLEFGVDLQKAKRVVLVDEEGLVISPGDVTDIDVYLSDGEQYCIEVKSFVDHHDVYRFYKIATILAPKEGVECSKLMIVALETTEKAREYCDKYKIILVSGDLEEE